MVAGQSMTSAETMMAAKQAMSLVNTCAMDSEDFKNRRAFCRNRAVLRKRAEYARHCETRRPAGVRVPGCRSSRNTPSQHARPHGAGRAAARTRLAHGAMEADVDVPSISGWVRSAKPKAKARAKAVQHAGLRISPALNPSSALNWVDEDLRRFLIPLHESVDAILQVHQEQQKLEAVRALAASEDRKAEVEKAVDWAINTTYSEAEALALNAAADREVRTALRGALSQVEARVDVEEQSVRDQADVNTVAIRVMAAAAKARVIDMMMSSSGEDELAAQVGDASEEVQEEGVEDEWQLLPCDNAEAEAWEVVA